MFKSLNPFKSESGAVASALQSGFTVPFLDPSSVIRPQSSLRGVGPSGPEAVPRLRAAPVFRGVLSHAEGSSYFCKNAFFSIIKTAGSLTIDYSDMHGLIGWMGTPTLPHHRAIAWIAAPHTLSRPLRSNNGGVATNECKATNIRSFSAGSV